MGQKYTISTVISTKLSATCNRFKSIHLFMNTINGVFQSSYLPPNSCILNKEIIHKTALGEDNDSILIKPDTRVCCGSEDK